MNNKLPQAEWDNRVEQDIINVVNYYLSGGSLKAAKEMDKAQELLADVLNGREARAHPTGSRRSDYRDSPVVRHTGY